ncbi:DNA-(apurinic or apyrimidinic site) lyase [Mycena indigotica]|uniref:DNA-(apurinic or apyrimidinic site) endonuclease n=1 Tax=Mycena indigotica TaxID=2126181 RepID=A0A8H6SCV4_9AGAR|nr:DNA-(apurinic or apyrimidinic site) lyase [Mycena indigotica]KAF7297200.1 DNA-(apurinic or apyrimidinic site) lyase [Mycena indigotica]
MRILTWNINGVRTIPQYHPWNTFKTHEEILNNLHADILCFQGVHKLLQKFAPVSLICDSQEMKSSRQNLPKAVGVPPSYHSFFSFPRHRSGYSGVAVYAKLASATPLKAEEGLTGLLQPNPPLLPSECISQPDAYPTQTPECEELDLRSLDSEGRALVIDFGLFVLVAVYCPNDGTDTDQRIQYKADFHTILAARIRGLVGEKREVILLGDLNACAAVIDHAEGPLMVARAQEEGIEGEEGFWLTGARKWLRDLIADNGGILVDVVRRFHPDRKGMYTCWNTKISARESNYGARIDYILVTPGLLPWIEAADIQPELKGSDHCPVFIDLRDSLVDNQGREILLQDVLGVTREAEPPRLAAKFWDEYKQRLLSTFFTTKTSSHPSDQQHPASPDASGIASSSSLSASLEMQPSKRKLDAIQPQSASQTLSKKPKSQQEKPQVSLDSTKLKKAVKGQTSLASFFAKPTAQSSSSKAVHAEKRKTTDKNDIIVIDEDHAPPSSSPTVQSDLDADYQFALKLSQEPIPSASSPLNKNLEAKAWGRMLAPPAPPRCVVHGEPAKSMTVTKTGPNKGKSFFICSRPVGPGYDAGKATRRRSEVDDQWRCNFFKWASDVRREEMTRKDTPD